MSTIYDKTDNYALNLYGDDDPADLRDGYNSSMRTIDTTMEQHLDRIESVEARETHDEEVVKALLGDNTVDNAMTAKSKWDKASSDSTAAGTQITNLRNDVDTLNNDVAKLKHARNIAVMIGDSITYGTGATQPSKRYSTVFCNMAGLKEKNYSWPGAGWIHAQSTGGGRTIPQLISQAVNDTAYDHNDVDVVVVACGINDNNANNISAIVQENLIALQGSFPKARYIELVCPTCGHMAGVQSTTPTASTELPGGEFGVAGMSNIISTMTDKALSSTNFIPVPMWYPLSFSKNASALTDDGLHPNDSGHHVMANILLGAYQGNGPIVDDGLNSSSIIPLGVNTSDGQIDTMKEIFTRINTAPSNFTFESFHTFLFNPIEISVTPSMASMKGSVRVKTTFTIGDLQSNGATAYIPLSKTSFTNLRTGIQKVAKRSSINSPMVKVGTATGTRVGGSTSVAPAPVWVQFDRMTGYWTLVVGELLQNVKYVVDVFADATLVFPTISKYIYAG